MIYTEYNQVSHILSNTHSQVQSSSDLSAKFVSLDRHWLHFRGRQTWVQTLELPVHGYVMSFLIKNSSNCVFKTCCRVSKGTYSLSQRVGTQGSISRNHACWWRKVFGCEQTQATILTFTGRDGSPGSYAKWFKGKIQTMVGRAVRLTTSWQPMRWRIIPFHDVEARGCGEGGQCSWWSSLERLCIPRNLWLCNFRLFSGRLRNILETGAWRE